MSSQCHCQCNKSQKSYIRRKSDTSTEAARTEEGGEREERQRKDKKKRSRGESKQKQNKKEKRKKEKEERLQKGNKRTSSLNFHSVI